MPSTIYLTSGDVFTVTASYRDAISTMLDHDDAPTAYTTISYVDPKADWFDAEEVEATYEETPLLVRPAVVAAVRACCPCQERAIARAREHQDASSEDASDDAR